MDTPATSSKPENYYRMPPVGLTCTRVMIGDKVTLQHTVRCGADDCWFVGHGGTQSDAQVTLNTHTCPTPPARNELPTGRSTLEKMWDEMDDVTTAILDKTEYNGMQGASLIAYAKGIAFTLSMWTHPYFKTISEISREAGARYKMSKKLIPWRPTPSYRYNPLPAPTRAAPNQVSHDPTVVKQAPKAAARKKATPAAAAKPNLSDDQIAAIKAAGSSGMFGPEELASMYKVEIGVVRALIASAG